MFEHDCLVTCCFGCPICMCLYFCICTCSAQLSMFHMERCFRNTLIIIIVKYLNRNKRLSKRRADQHFQQMAKQIVIVNSAANIIIIIIIAFKGAIRDFSQSPHSAANCLQHVHSSGPVAIMCKSLATHRALITCNMSCYMPLGTKGQLSY